MKRSWFLDLIQTGLISDSIKSGTHKYASNKIMCDWLSNGLKHMKTLVKTISLDSNGAFLLLTNLFKIGWSNPPIYLLFPVKYHPKIVTTRFIGERRNWRTKTEKKKKKKKCVIASSRSLWPREKRCYIHPSVTVVATLLVFFLLLFRRASERVRSFLPFNVSTASTPPD